MTGGVLCSSCGRKFISSDKKYSFIYRKTALWHKVLFFIFVTGTEFLFTRNILSFTVKYPSVTDIILLLSQKLFILVQEDFFVTLVYLVMLQGHVTEMFSYLNFEFSGFWEGNLAIPLTVNMLG